MALDFPNSPTNGLVYTSPTGEQWVYETATTSWTSKGLVNSSGGIKYVGSLDITAVPPTGVTGGALYIVAADGTANAGFGPGVTGALTKGDSVMNTGAGWIKLSHPTSVWLKTGTNLAPTATGDVVSISAGTAALPGLTPVGDANTGIYSPGADQVAVATNGTQRLTVDSSGRLLVGTVTQVGNVNGGILQLGSGITFPATAVAASDANTLDDYEEGTWTPNQGSGLIVVGTFSSSGRYTKVGNLVYVTGGVAGSTSIAITAGSILCSNLIFTQGLDGCGGNCTNYSVNETAGLFATGGSTNLYATSALTASTGIFFSFTFRV